MPRASSRRRSKHNDPLAGIPAYANGNGSAGSVARKLATGAQPKKIVKVERKIEKVRRTQQRAAGGLCGCILLLAALLGGVAALAIVNANRISKDCGCPSHSAPAATLPASNGSRGSAQPLSIGDVCTPLTCRDAYVDIYDASGTIVRNVPCAEAECQGYTCVHIPYPGFEWSRLLGACVEVDPCAGVACHTGASCVVRNPSIVECVCNNLVYGCDCEPPYDSSTCPTGDMCYPCPCPSDLDCSTGLYCCKYPWQVFVGDICVQVPPGNYLVPGMQENPPGFVGNGACLDMPLDSIDSICCDGTGGHPVPTNVGVGQHIAWVCPPTCGDRTLNQGEESIDCGGPNCPPCPRGPYPPVDCGVTGSTYQPPSPTPITRPTDEYMSITMS